MKRKDLIKILEANGWTLSRNGHDHDIYWSDTAKRPVPVKRHREISGKRGERNLEASGYQIGPRNGGIMYYVYSAVFAPGDGGYVVTVPDVPGCVSGGATLEEAMRMIKDALCGCLCEYEDHGVELAAPRKPLEIPLESSDSFTAMVDVDTAAYRARTDNRAVRKNVSIPAWMERRAEQYGLSLSQVLQEALLNRFSAPPARPR